MKSPTTSVNSLPEPFVQALLGCQDRLYTYLTSMLRSQSEVDDVLQETNLSLCQQADDFFEINDFTAWACRVAYYRVLAFRSRRTRDRHVFSEATLRLIADESQDQMMSFAHEQAILEKCFEKLTSYQQNIARKRYQQNNSVQSIAKELGRPPNTVSQMLCRIRAALLRCVLKVQASEEHVD